MWHTSEKAVRRGYLSSHESTVDVAHSPEVVSENDRATNAKARRSERRPVFGIVMNSSEDRECPADIETFEGMFKFTCIRLCQYRQDFLFTSRVRGFNHAGSTTSSHSVSVMVSFAVMYSDCTLCPVYSVPHITPH